MSDTNKHYDFVKAPMGDEPCTIIPGIGSNHALELMQHGYVKAIHILSLFLQPDVDKDEEKFHRQLLIVCKINDSNFQRVYKALKVRTVQHI